MCVVFVCLYASGTGWLHGPKAQRYVGPNVAWSRSSRQHQARLATGRQAAGSRLLTLASGPTPSHPEAHSPHCRRARRAGKRAVRRIMQAAGCPAVAFHQTLLPPAVHASKAPTKRCGSPARHTAAAGAGKAGAAAGSRAGLDDFGAEKGTHAVHQLLLGPTAILHLRQQQCTGAVYNGRRQCITGGQAGGQGSEEEGEQAGGPSGRHGTTKVLARQAEAASAAAATPISPAGPVCAPPTLA